MTEPRWLTYARSFNNLREVPGPRSNATILGWLGKLKAWWKDDATPWCGTFVAYVMQEYGFPIPRDWMRAKAWADWGSNLRTTHLAPGAILVFDRAGGGHVGFYVGEDATHYHVFGGNQSDSVNVMRLAKGRLIAARWPKGEPVVGRPVRMIGGIVSIDES
jgi:uncharacterized protein (TIGR02594 family)